MDLWPGAVRLSVATCVFRVCRCSATVLPLFCRCSAVDVSVRHATRRFSFL